MAECETIGQEGEGSGGNYRAFLLRCWQDEEEWRFTLVQVDDDHIKKGFASLEDVFSYLCGELENTDS